MTTPKNELLFLALGGSNEIGMNVNLYGCDGKWVMVDLGLTFANSEYPGVDLVLPDLEILQNQNRLKNLSRKQEREIQNQRGAVTPVTRLEWIKNMGKLNRNLL